MQLNLELGSGKRTQKDEHAPLQEMGWGKEDSLTPKPHNDFSSKDAQVSLKGHL